MPRMTSAAKEVQQALCVHFVHFAGRIAVEEIVSRRWASVTFAGERHVVRLLLEGSGAAAAVDAFLKGLDESEFDLPRHIVADVAPVLDERQGEDLVRLTLEALTVEVS